MKKAEFIKATAAKAGVSQKDAQAVTAAVIEVIKDALKKGDTVPFLGFGTFQPGVQGIRQRQEGCREEGSCQEKEIRRLKKQGIVAGEQAMPCFFR